MLYQPNIAARNICRLFYRSPIYKDNRTKQMGVKFRLIISLIFLYTQNIQSGIISAYKAYSARRQQRLQSAQQSLKLLNKENRRHYKAKARDFDKIIKGIVSRLDELQLYLETENWSNAQISVSK